jgi:hypothetical protein
MMLLSHSGPLRGKVVNSGQAVDDRRGGMGDYIVDCWQPTVSAAHVAAAYRASVG